MSEALMRPINGVRDERKVTDQDQAKCTRGKICFFGHFGGGNLGNESTLQAMISHVREALPNVEMTCICSAPETVEKIHQISAVPISRTFASRRTPRNRLTRAIHKLLIELPREIYRWFEAIRTLRGAEALIIPGTGLLTDAYSLSGWGPYSVFKWSTVAKLCGCKIYFVSVGVGPLYSILGKRLIWAALLLADFRSYRDESTLQWIENIGLGCEDAQIYPDLVFGFPENLLPKCSERNRQRAVVGLGLMQHAGRYSIDGPADDVSRRYLESLVLFTRWLLDRDWDVRLLIGDVVDLPTVEEFKALLKKGSTAFNEDRVSYEVPVSVSHLMSQIAATDIIVATRFHNVLIAYLLNKPAIAISFHHKCTSLMNQMEMSEYCLDINHLSYGQLAEKFCRLEENTEHVKDVLMARVAERRAAVNRQYKVMFE